MTDNNNNNPTFPVTASLTRKPYSKKRLEDLKTELAEKGMFELQSDEFDYLDLIWPYHIGFGYIKDIIGREPDNYYLEQAYRVNGELYVSWNNGNGWVGFGKLDDDELQTQLEKCMADVKEMEQMTLNQSVTVVPSPKKAEQRVCICTKESFTERPDLTNIVLLNTLDIPEHELQSLNEFYCTACNSFWREP